MSKFNLIEENWIPIRFPDGNRGELGIRATLLRAKEISGIEDPSPLVVAALYRFLLAVLYRALKGPTDIAQAQKLFKGGLPAKKIEKYLKEWNHRFWLLDGRYPFYQLPTYEPQEKNGRKQWRSWLAIASEHNADNAKVLFDHIDVNAAGSIPLARAARWLMACQTFALGGGNSDFVYTKSAPSATAALVIPLGVNLHDTLLLSLVPQNKEVQRNDLAIWEQEIPPIAKLKKGLTRQVRGFADLYSWFTRSIKFNSGEENCKSLTELIYASGIACSSQGYVDPMVAYRIDQKWGRLPIRFRERGLWRDFDSLLPDGSGLAPGVVDHATTLARSVRDRLPRKVMVVGQANDKAKIEFWRMERFALPGALATDRSVRTEIRKLLDEAEASEKSLWSASRLFARHLLSRGEVEPDANATKQLVRQMSLSDWYWSSLEARFHEILSGYARDKSFDEIRYSWFKVVQDALRTAWDRHAASVVGGGDAWAIRALVKAERTVQKKIEELNEVIEKLKPCKEVT